MVDLWSEWMQFSELLQMKKKNALWRKMRNLKFLISFYDQTVFSISEATVFPFEYSTSLGPNLDFS